MYPAQCHNSCSLLFYLGLQTHACQVTVGEYIKLVGCPQPGGAASTCNDKERVRPEAVPPQQLHTSTQVHQFFDYCLPIIMLA